MKFFDPQKGLGKHFCQLDPEPSVPGGTAVMSPDERRAPVKPVDRQAAIDELERRAQSGQLSPRAMEAWGDLKKRKGFMVTAAPAPDESGSSQVDGLARPIGVAARGFNKGMGQWVDVINDGLKSLGLPMSDTPFMGTAFVDKYLAGAQFQPQNLFESVLQRSGLEVGANVPLLGAAAKVGAMARATQEAGAARTLSAGSNLEALKTLPAAFAQQLAEVSPTKLAALESAIAAGAGTGAGLVHEIFPEGGRLAEFVGELVGSFTPSVVLGLTRKARDLAAGVSRSILGLETEGETTRRLGETLRPAATPEQIAQGLDRAATLEAEIPGLKLSTGEAIESNVLAKTQHAHAQKNISLAHRLQTQRSQNVEAVRNYFNATAPEGNTTRYAETLETARQRHHALLNLGVARTQARIDEIRGDISKRAANLLNDMEGRMFAADQRIADRLRAIGPQLSQKQRGELIRSEYLEELGKFRERARTDYAELDDLGHAELPVQATLNKLADLKAQFPEQFQILAKLNPRAVQVLDNLGHDYEWTQQLEKAAADLAMFGKSQGTRGGFRVFTETSGHGSTPEITAVRSALPEWYRGLTNRKLAGTDNVLDRATVEKAITTLRDGTPSGLNQTTLDHVADAIKGDREFRTSSFYDPVMGLLEHQPSAGLKELRQIRSDLLTMSRQARATDNRVQGYVLHELTSAVDHDIDGLLPGQSAIADHYPDHGLTYRRVSADYRAGVDTLMKGTANKLRQMNRYGDYTQDDESIPALFWRNETTMQDFGKAFQTPEMAKIALRDYALDRFMAATAHRTPDGRLVIDSSAAEEWVTQNASKLKGVGIGEESLEKLFRNTAKMQEEADGLRAQVEGYRTGKRGEEALRRKVDIERRPGEFSSGDLSQAEARLKQTQDIVDRTKHEWEASKASLFLKEKASVAGYRIATAKDPMAEYEKAASLVKKDPEAVAGLNKAIWEGLTEKLQPRLTGMTGETNIGVFHKELQNWLEGHGKIMEKVLGPEGVDRLKTMTDTLQKIARGRLNGSDTAINLQVQAALASTWLSRSFAMASGRVSHVFGVTERVATNLTKTFDKLRTRQQDAILLESFFDPKVYQTLVLAGTHGPDNQLVKHQLRLHLANMSEQQEDDAGE